MVRRAFNPTRVFERVMRRIWVPLAVASASALLVRLTADFSIPLLWPLPPPSFGLEVRPIREWAWEHQVVFSLLLGLIPALPFTTHLAVQLWQPELTSSRRLAITAVATLCFAGWLWFLPGSAPHIVNFVFSREPLLQVEAVIVGGMVETFAYAVLLFPATLALVMAVLGSYERTRDSGAVRFLGLVVVPAVLSMGVCFTMLSFVALVVALLLLLTASAIVRFRARAAPEGSNEATCVRDR